MAGAQAKRIHDRLTGVPATNAMLDAMEAQISSGNVTTAALYAMDGVPGGEKENMDINNWDI